MNTQSFLFENSGSMPEQIYIELMNKLKLDFEKKALDKELSVVVIDRNIPETVVICKKILIDELIKKSETFENRIDMPDRTQFIIDLLKKDFAEIRGLCKKHRIPISKQNPNWKRQEEAITLLKSSYSVAWSQQRLLNP